MPASFYCVSELLIVVAVLLAPTGLGYFFSEEGLLVPGCGVAVAGPNLLTTTSTII